MENNENTLNEENKLKDKAVQDEQQENEKKDISEQQENDFSRMTDKDIFSKKEKYEELKKQEEYQNTIVINGSNLVFNTGSIGGDINQNLNSNMQEEFMFQGLEDLDTFIQKYKNTRYVAMLITLSMIKIIPEQYFFTIADLLNAKINSLNEGDKEDKDIFLSNEVVIRKLSAVKVQATINSHIGKIPFECFMFKKEISNSDMVRQIWKNYIFIRGEIYSWLIEISRIQELRKYILAHIFQTITEIALMDFQFAQSHIIPDLIKGKNNDSEFLLVKLLEKGLQLNTYKQNIDNLLIHWCTIDNSWLWKIAFSLYDKDNKCKFHIKLKERLHLIIKGELEAGTEFIHSDVVYRYQYGSSIDFGLIQEHDELAEIYIYELAKIFNKCCSRKEKIRFGYYFVNLFYQDFMEEGYPKYKMVFLNIFNNKELRKAMEPVIKYIWETRIFREEIVKILLLYLKLLCDNNRDSNYIKCFIRAIAFTGEKEDYDNTVRFLEKAKDNRVAAQMKDYLKELLLKRQRRNQHG